MPESEAVYQPTTVGYTYDTGGDANDAGNAIRNGFSRITFRHKVNPRKWAEWVLLSVAICASVAGLTTLLVNLCASNVDLTAAKQEKRPGEVEEHIDDGSSGSIAVGATIMLAGMILGCGWAWLRFFRRSKSPRGGMARGSGQMLGGLNPSTDLLVGSTSQYGPVLTEVPSRSAQSKILSNSDHEKQNLPLSDQEEETRTLMPDATSGAPAATQTHDSANGDVPTGQIAG